MNIKCPNWKPKPGNTFVYGLCETSKGDKGEIATFGHCIDNCQATNDRKELEDYIDTLPRKGNKMPPKRNQLWNFITAMWQWAKTGFRFAELAIREKRFRICLRCEFLTNKWLLRCSKCGCCASLKKLFKSSSCPISKW